MKDNLIKDRVYIDEDIILVKYNNIDKYKEFIYLTKKIVYKEYVECYWKK